MYWRRERGEKRERGGERGEERRRGRRGGREEAEEIIKFSRPAINTCEACDTAIILDIHVCYDTSAVSLALVRMFQMLLVALGSSRVCAWRRDVLSSVWFSRRMLKMADGATPRPRVWLESFERR